jgi:hypothetical protein
MSNLLFTSQYLCLRMPGEIENSKSVIADVKGGENDHDVWFGEFDNAVELLKGDHGNYHFIFIHCACSLFLTATDVIRGYVRALELWGQTNAKVSHANEVLHKSFSKIYESCRSSSKDIIVEGMRGYMQGRACRATSFDFLFNT